MFIVEAMMPGVVILTTSLIMKRVVYRDHPTPIVVVLALLVPVSLFQMIVVGLVHREWGSSITTLTSIYLGVLCYLWLTKDLAHYRALRQLERAYALQGPIEDDPDWILYRHDLL